MKKGLLVILVIALSSSFNMWSQDIYLNAYGSYVFDNSFDSYYDRNEYYEGKIKGGLQWGAGIEYMFHRSTGVELLYLRQDTNSPTTYLTNTNLGVQRTNFDLGINYLMLGGVRHLKSQGSPLEGFGGLMAGMLIANLENPENGRSDTATKFSWGARLGGIYWFSSSIGLKVQAQLLSAVQAVGGNFYFSSSGPQAGVSSYSTIYQFSLGGGLIFKLTPSKN